MPRVSGLLHPQCFALVAAGTQAPAVCASDLPGRVSHARRHPSLAVLNGRWVAPCLSNGSCTCLKLIFCVGADRRYATSAKSESSCLTRSWSYGKREQSRLSLRFTQKGHQRLARLSESRLLRAM